MNWKDLVMCGISVSENPSVFQALLSTGSLQWADGLGTAFGVGFVTQVFFLLLFNALKERCWFMLYLSTLGTTVIYFLTLPRTVFTLTQNPYELLAEFDLSFV